MLRQAPSAAPPRSSEPLPLGLPMPNVEEMLFRDPTIQCFQKFFGSHFYALEKSSKVDGIHRLESRVK
jgi:hypothetical protein